MNPDRRLKPLGRVETGFELQRQIFTHLITQVDRIGAAALPTEPLILLQGEPETGMSFLLETMLEHLAKERGTPQAIIDFNPAGRYSGEDWRNNFLIDAGTRISRQQGVTIDGYHIQPIADLAPDEAEERFWSYVNDLLSYNGRGSIIVALASLDYCSPETFHALQDNFVSPFLALEKTLVILASRGKIKLFSHPLRRAACVFDLNPL